MANGGVASDTVSSDSRKAHVGEGEGRSELWPGRKDVWESAGDLFAEMGYLRRSGNRVSSMLAQLSVTIWKTWGSTDQVTQASALPNQEGDDYMSPCT